MFKTCMSVCAVLAAITVTASAQQSVSISSLLKDGYDVVGFTQSEKGSISVIMKKSGGWTASSKAHICSALPWEKGKPLPKNLIELGWASLGASAAAFEGNNLADLQMKTIFCMEVD